MKKIIKLCLTILCIVSLSCFVGCGDSDGNEKIEVADVNISFSKTEYSIEVGNSVELTVNNDSDYQVHWSSSDLTIINVIERGNKADVIGLTEGTAYVYASVLDQTVQATIKVSSKTEIQKDVLLTTNFEVVSLYLTQSVKLQGKITVGGKEQSSTFNFESMDESIVSVDGSGVLSPKALGQTYVKISTSYQGVSYSKDIYVSVIDNVMIALSEVSVEMDALTNGSFSTKQLNCCVYENEEAVLNPDLIWQSSDTKICEVDENGLISAVSAGETAVTVKYGNYTGSCFVKINYNKVSIQTANKIYIDLREGIDNNISLNEFSEMNGEEIIFAKNKLNNEWNINDTKLNLDTTKLIVGYNEYRFYSATKEFTVSLYTADRVIKSGDDFLDMLDTETLLLSGLSSQVSSAFKKTFVLGNDITLKNTKNLTDQNYYYGYSGKYGINYFVDIFDGDGHKISAQDVNNTTDASKRYIWTNGLFGFMADATVKNLIVENPLLVDNGFSAVGTIAQQVQGESVIENCVIINPTVKAGGSTFAAGFLAGRIYNADNKNLIIKNNLIIDYQSNPNFISYNRKNGSGDTVSQTYYGGERNSQYDGKVEGKTVSAICNFYAAIGDSALGAKNTDITDNLCLSGHGYINATNPNALEGIWFEEERMPDGKVFDSIETLIEENTENLKNYKYVSVVGSKIYVNNNEILFKKPTHFDDNNGRFNPNWAV